MQFFVVSNSTERLVGIMIRPRIIPLLMLDENGLYKTECFSKPKYVGDPINAVRLYNDKEVDELILVDFTASRNKRGPNFELISDIASECFMPVCYGGGIRDIEDIHTLFRLGVEKIAINSRAFECPELISNAANCYGCQSIVASIDVKRNFWGKYVIYSHSGSIPQESTPGEWAARLENMGAGELLVTSIDHEGTGKGYDIKLIKNIVESVTVPVIAHGGAGSIADMQSVLIDGKASAAAAGSQFTFHGKHRAVLISYPEPAIIERLMSSEQKIAS